MAHGRFLPLLPDCVPSALRRMDRNHVGLHGSGRADNVSHRLHDGHGHWESGGKMNHATQRHLEDSLSLFPFLLPVFFFIPLMYIYFCNFIVSTLIDGILPSRTCYWINIFVGPATTLIYCKLIRF